MASIFAEFFHNLDVPSSDIVAGFEILSKYQAAQRKYLVKSKAPGVEKFLSSIAITLETKFLDTSVAEQSHQITELIYYMNYVLSTYGWPLHLLESPCVCCCVWPYLSPSRCCGGSRISKSSERKESENDNVKVEIIKEQNNDEDKGDKKDIQKENSKSSSSEPRSKHETPYSDFEGPIILGDDCLGCNVASIENRLSSHNYEIIYVSYKVNVSIVPFLVVADHSRQTIVVSIRGSMSVSDIVTDLNGQTEKLPIENCPDDWIAHKGMTKAAMYVKSKLIHNYILKHAFNCRPDLGSREYNLVLCGHSLGAGTAAILGIILRKQYPTLKAYLYSPPGGILSLPAVEYTKEFATGIILGNDCVPRLGFAQLERLRYHTLLCLKRSSKSSGKIIAKALCPTICMGGNKADYDPDYSMDVLYGTSGRPFDYNGNKIVFQVQPTMLYVPGRLIHVVKDFTFKSKAKRLFNEPIYQAIWMENTSYDRIMVGKGMFRDHLPHVLARAIKMLFYSTLPARKELRSVTSEEQKYFGGVDHEGLKVIKVIAELDETASVILKHTDKNDNKDNNRLDERNDSNNSDKSSVTIYPNLNENSPVNKASVEIGKSRSSQSQISSKNQSNENLTFDGSDEINKQLDQSCEQYESHRL